MKELERLTKQLLEVGDIQVIHCGVCNNTKKRGNKTCKICERKDRKSLEVR